MRKGIASVIINMLMRKVKYIVKNKVENNKPSLCIYERIDRIQKTIGRMSSLNVFAKVFFPMKPLEQLPSRKEQAIHQLRLGSFSIKDQKIISSSSSNSKEFLKILCYNIESWGIRVMKAIELVYKVQASICIFTEVEELWNTC
jgi:hypothetical protein